MPRSTRGALGRGRDAKAYLSPKTVPCPSTVGPRPSPGNAFPKSLASPQALLAGILLAALALLSPLGTIVTLAPYAPVPSESPTPSPSSSPPPLLLPSHDGGALGHVAGTLPPGGLSPSVHTTPLGSILSEARAGIGPSPHLALTGPTASPASVDQGQWVNFSTTLTGGVPPYNYTWYGLPTPCNSSWTPVVDCLSTVASTFSIYVNASDSFAVNATSGTLAFPVLPDPVVSVTANRTSLTLGGSVQFLATASGGTGTYPTYAWTESSTQLGCASSSGPTLVCTPLSLGSGWTVSVAVTDSNGWTTPAQTSPPVSVQGVLTAPTPVANRTSVDVGQAVLFTETASGGSPPYSYSWSGLPSGCLASNSPSISCTVLGAGTQAVQVTVTDSGSSSATSPVLPFTSYADPVVGSPVASPLSVDAGMSSNLSVSVTGGFGPFSYAWGGLPSGCPIASPLVTCVFPTAGTYPVRMSVVDGNQFSVLGPVLDVLVAADPTVNVTGTRASVDLGQSVTFLAVVRGGVGNFTFNWSSVPCALGGPNPNGFPPSITCIPVVTGEFNVTALATDRVGWTSSSLPFRLHVWPRPWIESFNASATNLQVGGTSTFSVTAHGGGGTLHYAYAGLPKGCTGVDAPTLTCTFDRAGNYTVRVVVSDPTGANATASLSVHASGILPPSTPASSVTPVAVVAAVLLLGGLLVVALLGLMYVLFRGSRASTRPPQTGYAGLPYRGRPSGSETAPQGSPPPASRGPAVRAPSSDPGNPSAGIK